MLQIKNLTISHKKDLRTILENFSFVLNQGDKAVIIGEEGNGKSTLLKWIVNPESIEDYAEAEGSCTYRGERLGYLPQELPTPDKEKTIYEYFCEEPLFWEQTPKTLGRLAGELRLPSDCFYSEQPMGTLSGGEKVKVQMARLLLGEPTILLLDEPSNDIDIKTLEWLEQMIAAIPQAVLYISHDETLIERTANVIIHIEQIRRKTISRCSVARMSYEEYITHRNARLQNQEQQALTEKRQEKIRQEKFQRMQQQVEHSLRGVSRQEPHVGQLLKKKMKAVKSMEKRYEREGAERTQMPETEDAIFIKFGEDISVPAGKTVLNLTINQLRTSVRKTEPDMQVGHPDSSIQKTKTDVSAKQQSRTAGKTELHAFMKQQQIETASSEDGRILAENIQLQVRGSEKICIVGNNGAGKTTLIRRIAKELLARTDIRAAYMPQNYEELLNMDITPVEYLSVTGDQEEQTRIRTYLGSMKYTHEEMSRPIRELSGGQKAKVFLLQLSMSGAEVLILDEPTRNFSPLSNPVIREVLSAYGGAILSISHDRKYIKEVCEKVYELNPQGLEDVTEQYHQ